MEKNVSVGKKVNRIEEILNRYLTTQVKDVLCILLWSGVIWSFVNSENGMYQTVIDKWYYIAGIFFCLFLMLVRKTKLLTIPNLIVLVSFMGAAIFYFSMTKGDWGTDYRNVLIFKFIYILMLIIIAVDMIFYRRKLIKKASINLYFAILLILAAALMMLFDVATGLLFVFPIVFLLLTRLDRVEWNKLVFQFSVGFYITFVGYMIYSFLFFRDVYFIDGRYQGAFAFTEKAGLFAAEAFLVSICLGWSLWDRIKKNIPLLLFVLALPIFPFAMIMVFQDRSSFAGIFCILLALFLIVEAKKGKQNFVFAAIITVLLITALAQLGIYALRNIDYEALETMSERVSNQAVSNGIYYFSKKMQSVAYSTKTTGVYEPRTVMNSLDRLFSTRLSIWHEGLKKLTWFGVDDVSVTLPNGVYVGHVHNVFLDWILRYGVLGGVVVIGWFLACVGEAVKAIYDKRYEYIFPFLFFVFSIAFLFVETEMWNTQWGFTLILLQYPNLIRFREQRKNEITA